MKTVKLVSFVVLFSYINCQTLQTSLLHAVTRHINGQNHLVENLRDITSIMVAQFLQKASYEEVQTVVKELLNLAEKCKSLKSHVSPSECAHQLMTTFLVYICEKQGLINRSVFTDCCNPNNTARLQCFLSYKKADADSSVISLAPKPEQICEMDKENQGSVKARYSYETSRRYPFLYGPTILAMSACHEAAVQQCCQEENKTECFQIKLEPIRRYIRDISVRHHHLCDIGIKFNHKVAKAVELILLTKKQPKANFTEIAKLTTDIKNLHKTCCEGNTVACTVGRSRLMNYTCSNQGILSSKIAQCCELPEPFGGECIITSENDDKPNLSVLSLMRFTQDLSVCNQFTNKQDDFLQEFLYEYSRRYPELAVPVILRVFTAYENLLEKCCKLENPSECYRHGKEMFRRVVNESCNRVKTHCDLHKKLGDSNFHNRLLILYTKKAPQLSVGELVMYTKKMAAAASRCCPLSNGQEFACIEDSAKLILGALCRRHGVKPVNAGVGHCCDDSYAFRKPCFEALKVDGTFMSPSLPCDQVINLKQDLCKAREEELQAEQQRLLSDLVKQKPSATEQQLQAVLSDFTHLVEMCCGAGKSESCFQEEESKLISKCQSLLES